MIEAAQLRKGTVIELDIPATEALMTKFSSSASLVVAIRKSSSISEVTRMLLPARMRASPPI